MDILLLQGRLEEDHLEEDHLEEGRPYSIHRCQHNLCNRIVQISRVIKFMSHFCWAIQSFRSNVDAEKALAEKERSSSTRIAHISPDSTEHCCRHLFN